jgi:LysM repeat protein
MFAIHRSWFPEARQRPAGRPSTIPGLSGALGLVLALWLGGCGRSAPPEALGHKGGDPEIAGVSITSPDAVVSTVPGAETVPVPTTAKPGGQPAALAVGSTYKVKDGDTLSKIAGEHGVTIRALADANGITDVNSIKPGQQLVVPAAPSSAVSVSVVTVVAATGGSTPSTLLRP